MPPVFRQHPNAPVFRQHPQCPSAKRWAWGASRDGRAGSAWQRAGNPCRRTPVCASPQTGVRGFTDETLACTLPWAPTHTHSCTLTPPHCLQAGKGGAPTFEARPAAAVQAALELLAAEKAAAEEAAAFKQVR